MKPRVILGLSLAVWLPTSAFAQDPPAVAPSSNPPVVKPAVTQPVPSAPTKAERFDVQGRTAFLYASPRPAAGNPWVWYAPVVKGDVIIARHKFYFDGFLNAGIAVAGFDLGEVRGSPESTAHFTRFYEAMVERGYSKKPILLGQSRGGLMTLAWAVNHPEKVRAWAGIYPVCNLTSYPLKNSRRETLADFGMTEEQLRDRLSELNPIDRLDGLVRAQVPLFAVHGDQDGLVPYEDNTKLLKTRCEAAGGSCQVKLIPGGRHEVSPAFFECEELLQFVLKNARD